MLYILLFFLKVRDMFTKLLRPGLDFKAAFHSYAEKRWTRMRARSDRDLDDEEKSKMIASLALGRKDMQRLLFEMGIKMKKYEVNNIHTLCHLCCVFLY